MSNLNPSLRSLLRKVSVSELTFNELALLMLELHEGKKVDFFKVRKHALTDMEVLFITLNDGARYSFDLKK